MVLESESRKVWDDLPVSIVWKGTPIEAEARSAEVAAQGWLERHQVAGSVRVCRDELQSSESSSWMGHLVLMISIARTCSETVLS